MLLLIQHSRIKVIYSHPQKIKNSVGHEPTVPNLFAVTLIFKYMYMFSAHQVWVRRILNLLTDTCTMLWGWNVFGGGVIFFYKQMFFSTTLIGVSIFTFGGEFWSNLSCLFYKFISVISTIIILLYHVCGGWFTDGWLGHGCWYLWLSA